MSQSIRKLVIAGGGTAGWMAAALCRQILPQYVAIELIESEEIGIVGVGEATLLSLKDMNSMLGLDEATFMRETHATFKLAIRFENWRIQGDSYFHTFGFPSADLGPTGFHHYWVRAQQLGDNSNLWDYDLNYLCCQAGVVGKIDNRDSLLYAYHFDAALYGRLLRKICEARGVKRIEGKIQQVQLNPDTGDVTSLLMESGQRVDGDFFIDCSGMRGLLIQGALNTGYEDWSHWLPCDRAMAVPSERFEKTLPYTRAIAHGAGWQWRIPLTHRNGNGLVYSSYHLSDDEAASTLMSNLETRPLGDPKLIKFRTGRSKLAWNKNVVAIGLSSGFLEPLESSSIHLIQSTVARLLRLFSSAGITAEVRDQFNRDTQLEYEAARDIIILHYHLNERADTEFWRDQQQMAIPERLRHKIGLFKDTGVIFYDYPDIYDERSWLQVMYGQGLKLENYHPVVDSLSPQQIRDKLQRIAIAKRESLKHFRSHDEFLGDFVRSRADRTQVSGSLTI